MVGVAMLENAFAIMLSSLQNGISKYSPKDVFNCDESEPFWEMATDHIISNHSIRRRKRHKSRFTFMCCCNAYFADKIPLFSVEPPNRYGV